MDDASVKIVNGLVERCVHGIFELLGCSGTQYYTRANFELGVTLMKEPESRRQCFTAMRASYFGVVKDVLTTLAKNVRPLKPGKQRKIKLASTLIGCIDQNCRHYIPDFANAAFAASATDLVALFDLLSGKLQLITRMIVQYLQWDSIGKKNDRHEWADDKGNFRCAEYGEFEDDPYRMSLVPRVGGCKIRAG